MQKREKQLLGVVLSMGVLAGGYWLYDSMTGAMNRRNTEISNLTGELAKKNTRIKMGRQAASKLDVWQKHALPSDYEKARSAYSAWLRQLVKDCELGDPNVTPMQDVPILLKSDSRAARSSSRKVVYQRMPYSVSGIAGHGELIKFLFGFYSSGHMHLIRSLTLTPEKDGKFNVKILIDAVALPTSDRKDTLTELQGEPLAGGTVEQYREVIGKRNVFAAFKPEPPKRNDNEKPKRDPEVDPAKFAKVTAILTDPTLVVWIHVETTGKLFKLAEGQEFDLGEDRHGKVHRIHLASRTVELQLDEEKLQVALGQKLSEGKPLGNATAAR